MAYVTGAGSQRTFVGMQPQPLKAYWGVVLSSTFVAPSSVFWAPLCITFLVVLLVALRVFFAAVAVP